MSTTDDRVRNVLNFLAIIALLCCCILMIPKAQGIMIEIGSKLLPGRNWNYAVWIGNISIFSLAVGICLGVYLVLQIKRTRTLFEKHGGKILFVLPAAIIVTGVIVRIVMYAKNRSLWLDEALLAESIVSRNWSELLAYPLSNGQSAPVLYVVAVKAICFVLGYSECSLRFFSFISFIGLLVGEWVLLSKYLKFNGVKTAFILTITAVLPAYVYYSNESKPYMCDAFFVILTILLYHIYTQKKLSLTALTAFYLLILGFCSPSIFFIGGILANEFLSAAFAKNKRLALSVFISGVLILAVFYLYFRWWMLPALNFMTGYWGEYEAKRSTVAAIAAIFSPGLVASNALIWIFVPFALRGVYILIKKKDKVAYSVTLSLLLAFLASFIGMWPLIGRLWLFLPAVVLTYSLVELDFGSKSVKKVVDIAGFCLCSIIAVYYTISCIGKAGDRVYIDKQEVNPLILYVKEHIKEDEILYVYSPAQYALKFKNGYTTAKIGNSDRDNIIYGIGTDEWNDTAHAAELDTIVKSKKAYLLFQHHRAGINPGLAVLQRYGTITAVLDYHDTPLLYFEAYDDNASLRRSAASSEKPRTPAISPTSASISRFIDPKRSNNSRALTLPIPGRFSNAERVNCLPLTLR